MAVSFFWPVDGTGDLYASHPWDTVKIGDYQLPGICEIVGLKSARDTQTLKGAETDGARKRWRGYKPATFTVNVRIWTKAQADKLEEVLGKIWSKGSKGEPEIFPITHPQCKRLGIGRVCVVGVPGLEPGQVQGSRMQTLHIEEQHEPKRKVVPKPKPSKGKNRNELFEKNKPSTDQTGPGTEEIHQINPQLKSRG